MRYLALLLILVCSSCKFPQDPMQSFQEAHKTKLRVGAVIHPPFVTKKNGGLAGSEIEIIEGFAEKQNLQIDYSVASESELINKLEDYELHIVVGGFKKNTLWKKKTGLSVPYDKKHVLLIGKGENRLLYTLEHYIFKHVKKP